MRVHSDFTRAHVHATQAMEFHSVLLEPGRWQSMDVSGKPDMATYEVLNYDLTFPFNSTSLDDHRRDIKPNLPWADDHFLERVGGLPLNPGEQWAHWPWAHSADRFRREAGKFSHTYMERIWPPDTEGIRYPYGNLDNVVELLARDPFTRQAYLPIWFPEDTGAVHGERVPCTLGYHFIRRGNLLYLNYFIRSCDFVRHFRDDVYLSIRLGLWVLEQLKKKDGPKWDPVQPGMFGMFITSLHMFKNDYINLFGA